jgi:hypothetical protein
MLKTRFTIIASSVFVTLLLLCSGCSEASSLQVKAAEATTNITSVATVVPSVSPEPSIPPFDLSAWKLTGDEAVAIASHYVPAEITSHAKILPGMEASGNLNTGESRYCWAVVFMDISITKAWLGWQTDSQTTMESEGPFNEIIVRIDAVTGEYISRMAYFAPFIGGPGMTPSTETPWSPPATTAINPIQ